jgi:hypothetical protein
VANRPTLTPRSPQPTAKAAPVVWPDLGTRGDARPCLIPKEFWGGLFLITGERGFGKTLMGAGVEDEANTAFFDYEDKGEGYDQTLRFGAYAAPDRIVAEVRGVDREKMDLWWCTLHLINSMPKDRFTHLLIDNVDLLIDGMAGAVEDDPTRYGAKVKNVEMGAFGGAWVGVKYIWGHLMSLARSKGIKTVTIVAHTRDLWGRDGPILDKRKTVGLARIHELSVMSVVMMPFDPQRDAELHEKLGVEPYHPVCLVMKEQMGLPVRGPDNRLRVRRRIPFRISPAAMWRIEEYLREPADFRNLKIYEKMLAEEYNRYSSTFSKEQLAALKDLAVFTRSQMEQQLTEGE